MSRNRRRRLFYRTQDYPPPEEECHIVLHTNATNVDIVKSTLALCLLRTRLAQDEHDSMQNDCLRSSEYMHVLRQCYQQADAMFPSLLKSMQVAGWAPPARFMFGRVTMRAEWPLHQTSARPKNTRTLQTDKRDEWYTKHSQPYRRRR